MPVTYVSKDFTRVGRKLEGSTEAENKYSAKQIETLIGENASEFMTAALDVTGGDLPKVIAYFITGANHHLRLEAGGYDEWQSAAKKLLASGLPFVKGWDLEKAVSFLKAQS